MDEMLVRAFRIAGLCMLGVALAGAQDWQSATALPSVDLGGLTAAQKNAALKLLRARDCSCGCDMKVAECRFKDPNCYYSRGLSTVIVTAIQEGKSEADALAAAEASRFAHPPRQTGKLLDDAVSIPTAGSPVIGPRDARITLVEFSDFQCPYCVVAVAQLHAVLKAYPADVKLIFKQFPLDNHSQAALAAAAALAAQKQDKFWPMHDTMFAHHADLSREAILDLAAGLGLEMKRFEADMDSAEIRKTIARDVEDGETAGVQGTPTLFIDGQRYNGNINLEKLKPVLDGQLKKAPVAASRP